MVSIETRRAGADSALGIAECADGLNLGSVLVRDRLGLRLALAVYMSDGSLFTQFRRWPTGSRRTGTPPPVW
jgi:hypothetical protein